MRNKKKKISIVVPVFNEEGILAELYEHLASVTSKRTEEFEIIFVNDGSSDGTIDILLGLRQKDNRVCVIDFARNFGHQNSICAGLAESEGDAVILMDADMEDRPDDILKFLEYWDKGYEVVYAIRKKRNVSWLKTLLFKFFHKLNKHISSINMDATGTFGLMDRRVVSEIVRLKEQNRYMPGLRSWVGFKQIGIEIDRGSRYDDSPRVRPLQLYKLAFDSFTSFSASLLALPMIVGVIFFIVSIGSLFVILLLKIFFNIGPWGWTSLMSIILFISGIQFAFIGLLGEYISRIMEEVKGRPLYIIRDKYK